MNQSTNNLDGSLTFNFKVTKQEDGKVTVSCPTQPQIPPATAATHSGAMEQMKQRMHKASGTPGKLKGV